MKPKNKNNFKAVDFMRQVRNELSDLFHSDKKKYYDELKKSMADFLKAREKTAANIVLPQAGLTDKG